MESEGWQQLLQDEEETSEAADTDMPDVELQAADSAEDGGDAPSDHSSDDGADPAEMAAAAAAPGAPAGALFGLVHSVRATHRRNLVALLAQALQEADFRTAAGAAGTLLSALPRSSERVKDSAPAGGRDVVRLVHVLWGTLEVLLQNMAPQDQVKRTLRRMASLFQLMRPLRRATQLELILHTWKHSTAAAVLELIAHEEAHWYLGGAGSKSPFAYHLAWISALIKHRAWFQQVLSLQASSAGSSLTQTQAQQPQAQTQPPLQQQPLSTTSLLLGPLQLPFAPLSSLVRQQAAADPARSQQPGAGAEAGGGAGAAAEAGAGAAAEGREGSQNPGGSAEGVVDAAGDAAASLEAALKRVLAVSPGASQPVLLMSHMMVLSGRQAEAAAVAAAAAAAAGMSPESLSLWALLTEQQALAAAGAAVRAAAGLVPGLPAPAVHGLHVPAGGVHGHEHEHGGDADGDVNMDVDHQQQQQQEEDTGPAEPAAAAAEAAGPAADGPAVDDVDAAAEADADGAAAVPVVHRYVTACEEVLRVDPWALGAVEGLVQVSSHCHSCTAAAARGLLSHLDALATETAAAAAAGAPDVCADGCSCSSGAAPDRADVVCWRHLQQQQLCHWWPVLAGLLVQLAMAAAEATGGAAATEAASGQQGTTQLGSVPPPPAPAAATPAPGNGGELPPPSQQHQQQQQTEGDASAGGDTAIPAAAGGEVTGRDGPVCPWVLWQQLQQCCCVPRQQWWPIAGLCQPQELQLLTYLVHQQQHQQQQPQQQDSQAAEHTPQQPGLGLPVPEDWATDLSASTGGGIRGWGGAGSGGPGGVSGGGGTGLRFLPSQYHMPITRQRGREQVGGGLVEDGSHGQQGSQPGQQQQQEEEEEEEEEQEGDLEGLVQRELYGSSVQQQEHLQQQGLGGVGEQQVGEEVAGRVDAVCSAMLLLASKAVAAAFILGPGNSYSAAAAAAFAATAGESSGQGGAAAAAAAGSGSQSEDGGGGWGSIVCAADEARVAVQDALQLAKHLQDRLAQQQQQRQQRQQQQQQAPKRHFGVPTAEFGVLLDMPGTWWAAFPHKQRLLRQQQQQQQTADVDMG